MSKIYQHYKGGKYEFVGNAHHSEILTELVIYKSLEASEDFEKGTLWARPWSIFHEKVNYKGKKVPRFKLISK